MYKNLYKKICVILILFIIIIGSDGCSPDYSYYLVGSEEQKHELSDFFSLLKKYNDPQYNDKRFFIIKHISNIIFQTGFYEKQILFLTSCINQNPNDINNAYYLALIAQTYENINALPFAEHYYKRVLDNYADLYYEGTNIHYKCLERLVKIVKRPEEKIEYYKDLISRFSENIDLGQAYFSLAKAYEEVGEWQQAFLNYQQFLQSPPTIIAGHPNVYNEIAEKVALYKTEPEWVVADLDFLVSEIREAIETQNDSMLDFYRAKTNFFTVMWEQDKYLEEDQFENVAIVDYIGAFLVSSNVVVAADLDIDSNSQEAFLRTENWTYRINTWYFYFKRVDYGPDPDINGGWEWAGIYFGEKL